MKRLKSIIVIALCFLVAIVQLTSCVTAGGTPKPVTTEAPPAESKEPPVVKYLTVTWGDFTEETEGNQRIRKALLEKLNIDVQLTVIQKPEDYGAMINLAIASGEKYDLIQLDGANNNQMYKQLVDEDYLTPLDDLLVSHGKGLLNTISPESFEVMRRNGKIYGWSNEGEATNVCMVVRKDLIEKYNLPFPTSIEEYENAAKTVIANEQGFVGLVMSWDSLDEVFGQAFMPVPGKALWLDSADNKLKPSYIREDYKDFLATMRRFYEEGIIHPEYLTMQIDQFRSYSRGGTTFSFTTGAGITDAPYFDAYLADVNPEGENVLLMPLKGTHNAGYLARNTASGAYVIPKSSKVPEKAMEYANFAAGSVEGWALTGWGQVHIDYKRLDSTPDKIVIDHTFVKAVSGPETQNGLFRAGIIAKNQHSVLFDNAEKWYSAQDKVKIYMPVTFGMVFDPTLFKSKDVLTDLEDLFLQERNKVILGQASAADWDKNFVQKWLEMGGKDYIEDYTTQYNEFK